MRRHTGRPGTAVIPAGWDADHAPVVAATLDCEVRIAPPGDGPLWNPASGQTETLPADPPTYDGPASIAPVSDTDRVVDAADEQEPLRAYLVQLDRAHDGGDLVADGHVVTVTAAPDPALVGLQLTVDTVARGRRFGRFLRCTLPH